MKQAQSCAALQLDNQLCFALHSTTFQRKGEAHVRIDIFLCSRARLSLTRFPATLQPLQGKL